MSLLYEFRHVMLDRDGARPKDPREEEMACDVWAREFMTSNLAEYARRNRHDLPRSSGQTLHGVGARGACSTRDHAGLGPWRQPTLLFGPRPPAIDPRQYAAARQRSFLDPRGVIVRWNFPSAAYRDRRTRHERAGARALFDRKTVARMAII
jgi:hypothetical protein